MDTDFTHGWSLIREDVNGRRHFHLIRSSDKSSSDMIKILPGSPSPPPCMTEGGNGFEAWHVAACRAANANRERKISVHSITISVISFPSSAVPKIGTTPSSTYDGNVDQTWNLRMALVHVHGFARAGMCRRFICCGYCAVLGSQGG